MAFSCCIILVVYFNSCVIELVLLAVELLADEFYEPTIICFTLFLVMYFVGIPVLCPYLTGYGISASAPVSGDRERSPRSSRLLPPTAVNRFFFYCINNLTS